MKIVFLDIDGVLNCQSMHTDGDTIIGTRGRKISARCLDTLNTLINDTGAKIVLSSTWRMDDDAISYLQEAGLTGEIIGKTPILNDRFTLRGNEIHAWIVLNEQLIGKSYSDYHTFAIIDDDSDMLLWHKENFFKTDGFSGLTPNMAYRITRFLNRD